VDQGVAEQAEPRVTGVNLHLFRALLWGDPLIRMLLGVAKIPSATEMEHSADAAGRALLVALPGAKR